MSWLAPLGFLGLLGIIALIIIYIIKPNYQQKMISSTFVWRLSLKYRKKRLPINRLQNILLFLCQVLILTICALLLAQPVLMHEKIGDENEKVIIIDASASMRLTNGASTRFERAVDEARALVLGTLEDGGLVSVILADDNSEFLFQRAGSSQTDAINAAFDALLADGTQCTYSSADIKGAVALSESVLNFNNEAQVHLFTATEYVEKNEILVQNVAEAGEWNAAILGCTAEMNENNHYEINVELGCYGRTETVTVTCEIHGVNGNAQASKTLTRTEFFDPAEEEKVISFNTDDMGGEALYSFDYLELYISVEDSFVDDNIFFLYGGTKPTIRVQYSSSIPNNYFAGMVRTMRQTMKNAWNIEFVQRTYGETVETEGFDFYIFEHRMPDVMPTDGVVLLVDPDKGPDGSGLRIGEAVPVKSDTTLATGAPHNLMTYVDSSRITIAKYREIISSDGYEELAYYNGKPMILVKNEQGAKVVVWAFDLNYSNLCAIPDFSFMMFNMFNYFIPRTLTSNSFEIGDTVTLTGRGTDLKVEGNGEEILFENAVGELKLTRPGTYTATQKTMKGDALITENFFVTIPAYESNVTKQVDALPMMSVETVVEIEFEDLLFYFAIALVTLMFAEWALQTKQNY